MVIILDALKNTAFWAEKKSAGAIFARKKKDTHLAGVLILLTIDAMWLDSWTMESNCITRKLEHIMMMSQTLAIINPTVLAKDR